jgi:predicted nucleotidyltransferase
MNLKKLIGFKDGILIGSRALQVARPDSDFDIVVKEDDMPDMEELSKKYELYFTNDYNERVVPLGNHSLLRINVTENKKTIANVDLIVIDRDKDYEAYKNAINTLKALPQFLLTDKETRIKLFEESLIHFGLIRTEDKDDIPF